MSDSGSITATIETIPQGWFYTRYLGASSISFTPPGNGSGDIRKNDTGEGKKKSPSKSLLSTKEYRIVPPPARFICVNRAPSITPHPTPIQGRGGHREGADAALDVKTLTLRAGQSTLSPAAGGSGGTKLYD